MARQPKPWYRRDRKVWCVTIHGFRHVLGPKRKEAFEKFYALMREPQRVEEPVAEAEDLAAIIDAFLDWTSRNRSAATYEWYRYRLQSFVDAYPQLTIGSIKPHHVERWAGNAEHSVTTRRNAMRAVKRCLKWAVAQGYLDVNPIERLEIPSGRSREVYIAPDRIVTGYAGGPLVMHTGSAAMYLPSIDTVRIAGPERFQNRESYYATMFHELVHSTGHKTRLNRGLDTTLAPFGSPDYSKEELVAEIGSAFLCAVAGISPPTIEQSAAYIDGWRTKLHGDKKLIVQAAGLGQRAADHILGVTFGTDKAAGAKPAAEPE